MCLLAPCMQQLLTQVTVIPNASWDRDEARHSLTTIACTTSKKQGDSYPRTLVRANKTISKSIAGGHGAIGGRGVMEAFRLRLSTVNERQFLSAGQGSPAAKDFFLGGMEVTKGWKFVELQGACIGRKHLPTGPTLAAGPECPKLSRRPSGHLRSSARRGNLEQRLASVSGDKLSRSNLMMKLC